MPGMTLASFLDPAALLLVGTAFGGMVYFAATVAPVVFRTLAADEAGRLIRRLFPPYYRLGAILTGLATLLLIVAGSGEAWATGCTAAVFLLAWMWLMPRINAARDAEAAGVDGAGRRFARLHRLSVALNVGQMALLAVVIVRLA
jgi:hypothetical protein